MRPLTRRTVLLGGLFGTAAVAGCLEAGDENARLADRDGGDAGREGGGADHQETDSGVDAVWTRDVRGSLLALEDGTLYGRESFEEGSGGVIALEASTGERRWTYGETGGLSSYSYLAVDDAVYFGYGDDAIGSGAGELYALERGGTERWTADTGSVYDPPRVADGTVYVGSDDGRVYAFEGASGDERWAVSLDDAEYPGSPTVEVVADGTVYVTFEGTVAAFDAETGEQQWGYDAAEYHVSSLSVDDHVFVAGDEHVVSLAVADGGERWTTEFDERASIHGVESNALYVGYGPDLSAIDPGDGTERWHAELESNRALYVDDEAILVGTEDLRSYTLEGIEEWTVSLDGTDVTPITATDDSVYAKTDAGVYRLDRTGDVVSSAPIDEPGHVLVGEYVYVTAADRMYGLEL